MLCLLLYWQILLSYMMQRTSSILFSGIVNETCLQYNKDHESALIDK